MLKPVPRLALADHGSFEEIQCSQQCGSSVAFVIVRLPLRQTGTQRENRLRPVQRLNLALLVHAQNDRFIRRVDIGPTMPRTFGANCGSLLNLNDSTGRALYAPTRSL